MVKKWFLQNTHNDIKVIFTFDPAIQLLGVDPVMITGWNQRKYMTAL